MKSIQNVRKRRLILPTSGFVAAIVISSLVSFAPGQEAPPKPSILANEYLQISFDSDPESGTGSRFDVLDKRTSRVWKQVDAGITAVGFQLSEGFASFDLILPRHSEAYHATVRLEPDKPEFVVELVAPAEASVGSPVFYPPAFAPQPGDRILVPIGEGISYPVEDSDAPQRIFPYYAGHGITMAFFATTEERVLPTGRYNGGSAYMAICETPDNSGVQLLHTSENDGSDDGLLTIRQVWGADRGRFGYARRVRFIFFPEGGHVAVCKRYRRYATELGYVVPFAEKIRRNPARKENLEKLFGAANIWVLSGKFRDESKNLYEEISGNYRASLETQRFMDARVAIYRDMRANGMDRLLIGAGSDAEHVRQINAIDGALSSRYDIYQDVMDPSQYANLTAIKNEWPKESFPHDLRLERNDSPSCGWKVPLKAPVIRDGKRVEWIQCNQLCDRQAVPYVRKRIAEELERKPYTCRFIDVTAASIWSECWSPVHPMTRSECREFRAKLLAVPGEEFDLVLGSEAGHEVFVPCCDYFEGILSMSVCRVPDAGRDMATIWDQVPAVVAKYQTGEAYRLPLFELVYHGCVVPYWYWGDSNNKLPALWGKRDLFNALYGAPPMYVVTPDNWPEFREQVFASYRIAEPVSKLTAQSEMTDHQILTADRTVQQTSFANGVRVTVNFGDADFTMRDCTVLESGTSRIERLE